MILIEFALLIPLLVAHSPAEQPVPPKIARFLTQCETSRRGVVLQIEHRLRGLRQEKPLTPASARQIGLLEEQLRILESGQELVVPPLSFPLQSGSIGRFDGLECHVDQVVSRQELLVRCAFRVPVITVRNFQRHQEIVIQSVPLLIRGLEQKPPAEGQDWAIPGVFEVTGVERYQTVGGGPKNLTVLAPFDLETLAPYRKASRPR
jgi:hypothetical protein